MAGSVYYFKLRTSTSETTPPTTTSACNPITFKYLKRRRPLRNIYSKTCPKEFSSWGEILLCDVPAFSEETLELAQGFSRDFDGRCNIRFVEKGFSSKEEVCLIEDHQWAWFWKRSWGSDRTHCASKGPHVRLNTNFTPCEGFWWLNDFRCIESCGSGLAS